MSTPERRCCRICGYPLDSKNRTGLCSNRTPACRKARDQLTADQKPGKFRVAIAPGDIFGRWTALEAYSMENKNILCRCECGAERRVFGIALTNGHSLSCGVCIRRGPRLPKEPYLKAGQVFARLTVLEDVMYSADYALCCCECEAKSTVRVMAASVRNGHTRSCGCLWRETLTTHGLTGNPLYEIWKGIIGRCTKPSYASWDGYGGRGITICDRWRYDVRVFVADIEAEIGPRPEGKGKGGRALYELDRTDNDRGYEPGNVRWSDRSTQMQNRRKVPKLTKDVLRLTEERDALAVELAALKVSLPPGSKRKAAVTEPDIRLF